MTNAKTEGKIKGLGDIAKRVARALVFQVNSLALAVMVLMPFILIEDQSKPEFWQSVGCYGVFLIGVAAINAGFYPRMRSK